MLSNRNNSGRRRRLDAVIDGESKLRWSRIYRALRKIERLPNALWNLNHKAKSRFALDWKSARQGRPDVFALPLGWQAARERHINNHPANFRRAIQPAQKFPATS